MLDWSSVSDASMTFAGVIGVGDGDCDATV
jgi:hypothetical protein